MYSEPNQDQALSSRSNGIIEDTTSAPTARQWESNQPNVVNQQRPRSPKDFRPSYARAVAESWARLALQDPFCKFSPFILPELFPKCKTILKHQLQNTTTTTLIIAIQAAKLPNYLIDYNIYLDLAHVADTTISPLEANINKQTFTSDKLLLALFHHIAQDYQSLHKDLTETIDAYAPIPLRAHLSSKEHKNVLHYLRDIHHFLCKLRDMMVFTAKKMQQLVRFTVNGPCSFKDVLEKIEEILTIWTRLFFLPEDIKTGLEDIRRALGIETTPSPPLEDMIASEVPDLIDSDSDLSETTSVTDHTYAPGDGFAWLWDDQDQSLP